MGYPWQRMGTWLMRVESGALSQTKTIPLSIVGGTNFSRYPKMSTAETINMMVTGDEKTRALVPYAGYTQVISFPAGEPRETYGSTRIEESVTVIGANVYLVDNDLGYRLIGQLDSFEGPVYISENQNSQIGIVDGLALYVYNYLFNTFTRIDIPGIIPSYIDFLDTYTIITDTNRGIFILSAPNDMTSYSALDEATIQTEADQLQAVVRLDRTLFVMGKKATELWNDQPNQSLQGLGTVSFPFKRNNTFSIDYGCLSQQTIASAFQMLVWLGFNTNSGPTIVYTTGGKPKELSTEGLDYLLRNLVAPEQSSAFLYKDNGHIMYQITFYNPEDDLTIVYDFNSELWYYATDPKMSHYIAKRVVSFNNNFYFINYDTNNPGLFEMSVNILTYNGETIQRVRITDPIRFNDKKFMTNRVEIQMEQGQSSDYRRIDLAASFDGGESFQYGSQPFVCQELGHRIGQVRWWKLGLGNDLTLKFQFWSQGRFVVISGEMDIIL